MNPWLLFLIWVKLYQSSIQDTGEDGLAAINRRSSRRHKQNQRNQKQ